MTIARQRGRSDLFEDKASSCWDVARPNGEGTVGDRFSPTAPRCRAAWGRRQARVTKHFLQVVHNPRDTE
jgi:hypothetical protein